MQSFTLAGVAPRIDWMLFLELCSLLHWPALLPESIGCFFLNYAVFYIGRRCSPNRLDAFS
jgi:hypothetical protein